MPSPLWQHQRPTLAAAGGWPSLPSLPRLRRRTWCSPSYGRLYIYTTKPPKWTDDARLSQAPLRYEDVSQRSNAAASSRQEQVVLPAPRSGTTTWSTRYYRLQPVLPHSSSGTTARA